MISSRIKFLLIFAIGLVFLIPIVFYISYPRAMGQYVGTYYDKFAAQLGDPESQFQMALLYRVGSIYISKNQTKSLYWFRKAAENGHILAQIDMGYFYEYGVGVEKNFVEAMKWYRRAEAHPLAKANIANFYVRGVGGVNKDSAKAIELYKEAALSGHEPSILQVGLAYESGDGISRDRAMAEEWYKRAYEKNHSRLAPFYLGRLYLNDRPQNFLEASKWFAIGTEMGEPQSIASMAWLYENGFAVPRNIARAKNLYRQANEKGFEKADQRLQILKSSCAMARNDRSRNDCPEIGQLTAP